MLRRAKSCLLQQLGEPYEMRDRLFGCHAHRDADHHYVTQKCAQEGWIGCFFPRGLRQLLDVRYLPHNVVEGCLVGAVQRVDGYVPPVATTAKAEIG